MTFGGFFPKINQAHLGNHIFFFKKKHLGGEYIQSVLFFGMSHIVLCILGHDFFIQVGFWTNLWMLNRMIDFIESHNGQLNDLTSLKGSDSHFIHPSTCPFEFLWASLAPACFDWQCLEGIGYPKKLNSACKRQLFWGGNRQEIDQFNFERLIVGIILNSFHPKQEPVMSWHCWVGWP